MAEIKVERKQRNLLPLLLGLLALAALLWWFMNRHRGDVVASTDTTSVATGVVEPAPGMAVPTAAAVAGDSAAGAAGAAAGGDNAAAGDFAAFIANGNVERNEDQQHEYTAGGIRRLASAIESMNPGGAARAQLDLMRQKADSLQVTSPGDDRHADMTRAAFGAAADAMASLPGATRASSPLQAVRQAATAIRPERHMLAQKDQIQTFFDAARDALQAFGRGA